MNLGLALFGYSASGSEVDLSKSQSLPRHVMHYQRTLVALVSCGWVTCVDSIMPSVCIETFWLMTNQIDNYL